MTADEETLALALAHKKGFRCLGFVVFRESDDTSGLWWLGDPPEDFRRLILQLELDGTYEAECC